MVPQAIFLIFGLYFSLRWGSWIPISVGILLCLIAAYAQTRLIPLILMSKREVFIHRLLAAVLFLAFVGWATYQSTSRNVGL